MHVLEDQLIFRPYDRDQDRLELLMRTSADKHHAVLPTHVWRRGEQITAYASIGEMVVLGGWSHSRDMTDAEAMRALEQAEDHARLIGARHVVMPCAEDCRYAPFLGERGYKQGMTTVKLNLKRL